MKMIEVLQKVANGEIKDQTTLKIYDTHVFHTYTFEGKYNSFYSNTKYRRELGGYFKISGDFLNYEVELIPPKPKKYYLRLYEDDSFSYINKNKIGCTDYKTKFTQEEIDGSMLLKFIERHGIKEEVSD
ncbi:hypothetical protein U1329_02110 [Enterococcus cecorum]|nr:hypothetical protein [Enterococcus cecorum]MCJ0567015.1 hypothetical protein [Enterococcus cecorum]MDZ5439303.1 hypothetical protein [Enterococcus cecorum]MDZ5497408.1 hypothetical protein [Enterococcus cecorum]MDZ5583134.1 hypothetical protein [Enterococcus cecorum]MDZ5585203.1 hypothetical protein [Enterococcus cecorum]